MSPDPWQEYTNLERFRENRFYLETRTPTLHNNKNVSLGSEAIMSLKWATWHNLCYAKDSFKKDLDKLAVCR